MIEPPHPVSINPTIPTPLVGRTILLVEDESFISDLLIKWLERLGATVLCANNAAKALELFQPHANSICCVIADFRLPDMDGHIMCTHLREQKPRIPVLLTSGRYQGSAEKLLTASGPTDFIQKPYPLDAVLQKLLKLIAAE